MNTPDQATNAAPYAARAADFTSALAARHQSRPRAAVLASEAAGRMSGGTRPVGPLARLIADETRCAAAQTARQRRDEELRLTEHDLTLAVLPRGDQLPQRVEGRRENAPPGNYLPEDAILPWERGAADAAPEGASAILPARAPLPTRTPNAEIRERDLPRIADAVYRLMQREVEFAIRYGDYRPSRRR